MAKRIVKKNGTLSKPIGPKKGDPRCKTARKGQAPRNVDAIAKMKSDLEQAGLYRPRPAWRPTKYRPEFCEEIIEFCKDGLSLTSFAAEIRVPPSTMFQWANEHLDFRAAMNTAKAVAAAFHDKQGVKISQNGSFNKPGQGKMVEFYLRNHARDEFNVGSGDAAVSNSQNVIIAANVTKGLEPREAMDMLKAALRGELPAPKVIEHDDGES